MTSFIVDTNVVIKWFFEEGEKHVRETSELYLRLRGGGISVSAPSFLLVETANILLKKKKISQTETNGAIERVLNSGINFVDFSYLKINDLLKFTEKYGVTTYDATYLLLASEMNCKLISDDGKLKEISELVVGLEDIDLICGYSTFRKVTP